MYKCKRRGGGVYPFCIFFLFHLNMSFKCFILFLYKSQPNKDPPVVLVGLYGCSLHSDIVFQIGRKLLDFERSHYAYEACR